MAGWILAVDIDTSSVVAAVQEQGRALPVELTASPANGTYSATLRAVALEAAGDRAPAIPSRLVLAVPAAWTGRDLALLRQAALDVNLPDPDFTARPIAAACHLGARTAPGQLVAVLRIRGGSIDAAVLRRTPEGFELAGLPGGLATADDASASLERGVLELLATVTAAGLSPGELAAVHVIGPADRTEQATALVTRFLGIEPRISPAPETASVLGALAMIHDPAPMRVSSDRPPSRVQPVTTAGRSLAAHKRTWAYTSLAVVAVVAATLTLAHAGGAPARRSAPSSHAAPSSQALSNSRLGYQVALHTVSMTPTKPVSYTVRAQYPVVTGLSDLARQRQINADLRAPVSREISSFSTLTKSAPAGVGGAFLNIGATVYQVKNVLSVKYLGESHNAGAGDVSYTLNAVTIQMSTGAPLGLSDMLTPAALTAAGRNRLAADLQAQHGIRECDTLPGWTGEKAIVPALARIRAPGYVVLNVTPGGLAFSFGDDAISPTVCRPVGVMPAAELSGLITPSIAALGPTAAPSTAPTAAPSAASTPTAPAAPAGPAAVVRAYFAAINQRDYRRAWRLGGDRLGQSYAQFAAGFAGTARDVVRIVSVTGGSVAIKLTAIQSDGRKLVFTGTYSVTRGKITGSALVQAP